jgi:hypothetical protein
VKTFINGSDYLIRWVVPFHSSLSYTNSWAVPLTAQALAMREID